MDGDEEEEEEMKKLLLLHYNADCNTNDIWKAAIQNGWATERIHDDSIGERSAGFDYVRYYGNTLQAERVGHKFPFKFYPIDETILAKCPFTRRRVDLMKFKDLPQPMIEKKFVKPFYQKYFPAKVYDIGEKIDFAQMDNDLIYAQEPVSFVNEIRCFCLDGKILTASYYRKDKEYCPENINLKYLDLIIHLMVSGLYKYNLPRGCVLDFGLLDNGKWAFLEPNEAWASGIYDCEPKKCLEVIENSQYDE